MDELALLQVELDALWVTDDDGALLHCRTAAREPSPLLVVGAGAAGLAWATSVDVPAAAHDSIATLLEGEPAPEGAGWAPARAAGLLAVVGQIADLAPPHGGPSFVVPGPLAGPAAVDLRTSTTTAVSWLRGRMPERDRHLTAPWVAAVVDGQVAAVCETARSTPAAVEAGVWTYPAHRRRGLGAAVTAAWSALVTERTALYSTSWDNLASQGVARRLGLRPLAQWWQLSRGGT
jgi:GNAT superfamily N-acetyltransferase